MNFEYKINYKTHSMIFVISLAFLLVFNKFIFDILEVFFDNTVILSNKFDGIMQVTFPFILEIMMLVSITIVHELIHGTIYKLYGGKVSYSFKVVYAATRETSGIELNKNQFLIVLLSPVVIISLISLLVPLWLGSLLFLMNLIGSIGDIYMAIGLYKYPKDCKIIDSEYGYKVLLTN